MERSSDKHGTRVDEEMKLETSSMTDGAPTESRSQETREKEPPGNREPVPDERLTGDGGQQRPPSALSDDEVEARQNLARNIETTIFPAERDEVIASAERMQAPQPVLATLRQLPEGRYEVFEEIWEALGGRAESGRS